MADNKTTQIGIYNLKCGGRAKAVVKGLRVLDGVGAFIVDHGHQTIRLLADEATRPVRKPRR